MRTIQKGAECPELKKWKRENVPSPQNIHYDNLSGVVKTAMLNKLVKEQFGLCAYTMKPISGLENAWHAHIEHIWPRSAHSGRSVTWSNLVACVPKHGVACDYGAIRKGAYDPASKPFLDPIIGGVSNQLRFRESGEVDGQTPAALAAVSEVVLHLNHRDLVNDRVAKIRGALGNRPTAAAALHRARELRRPDRYGRLEPYCEAVAQVLENYAQRLQNRANRLAGARRT